MYGVQRVDVNPMQAWLFGRATGLQVLKAWPRGTSLDWQQYLQQAGLQFGRQCVTPMVPRIQPVDVQNAAGHVHNVTLPAPGKARFGAGHSGTATDRAMAGAFGYNRRGISRTGAGLGSAAADREQQLMRASAAAQWAGRVPVAVFGGASDTPEAAAAEAAATSDSSASSSDVEAGDVEHQQMHLSAQARTPGSSWASQDLTYVLRDKYSSWLHQVCALTASSARFSHPQLWIWALICLVLVLLLFISFTECLYRVLVGSAVREC